jgi:CRISPR/Cas system CSM-associated protein Csm5 (group 7 of RAMP superfamily)
MIIKLSPVRAFIIKSGRKFSLFDLYQEGNIIYRINTDEFIQNLGDGKLKQLDILFKDFFSIKKDRDSSNKERKYADMWAKINSFNKENNAKLYRILPPIAANQTFMKNSEFDEYVSVERKNGAEYELIPYIPGSTVKGAIRRMLIYQYIDVHGQKSFDLTKKSPERDGMEKKIKSIMSSIQVSDFYPAEKFEIKMTHVQRSPSSIKSDIPLVTSGDFYGEIKVNVDSRNLLDIMPKAVSNNNDQGEISKKMMHVVLSNSSTIFLNNREKYGELIPELNEKENLLALGFGKGLSLSGFVAVKEKFNLKLPETWSVSLRKNIDQDYQKTNYVYDFYNGQKFGHSKVGIVKVEIVDGVENMTDVSELKYILKDEGSR